MKIVSGTKSKFIENGGVTAPDVQRKVVTAPAVRETCQARKVGNRICGAKLKTSPTGFSSCSNRFCQVPAGHA